VKHLHSLERQLRLAARALRLRRRGLVAAVGAGSVVIAALGRRQGGRQCERAQSERADGYPEHVLLQKLHRKAARRASCLACGGLDVLPVSRAGQAKVHRETGAGLCGGRDCG
jgi:hypothetical protein